MKNSKNLDILPSIDSIEQELDKSIPARQNQSEIPLGKSTVESPPLKNELNIDSKVEENKVKNEVDAEEEVLKKEEMKLEDNKEVKVVNQAVS